MLTIVAVIVTHMCHYIVDRPGLVKTQQDKVNARSLAYFGVQLSNPPRHLAFDELVVGSAYSLTLRYAHGFVPLHPTQFDIGKALGGGYAQPHVLVTAAKVVCKVSINQTEVELDTLVSLSHGSGPTQPFDHYVLHRDGSVRFWDHQTGEIREWNEGYRPTWEHTAFPVLPTVVGGLE